MIALPQTEVTDSLAPDTPRGLIINKQDLDSAMERVLDVLRDPANPTRLRDRFGEHPAHRACHSTGVIGDHMHHPNILGAFNVADTDS